MTDEIKQRQEDELQVLQSIYMGDVIDLRTQNPWKVWQPLELILQLKPQESMQTKEAYAQLDLYIKCSATYPLTAPEVMDLRNVKNVPKIALSTLQAELAGIASKHIGEVVILNLAQRVQEFLCDYNRPQQSFYDEMVGNRIRKEQELAKQLENQLLRERQFEEKRRQEMEQEIQRRQEELREEAQRARRRASSLARGDSESSTSTRDIEEPTCSGHIPCPIDFSCHKSENISVIRGQCISHDKRGFISYIAFCSSSGAPYRVTQWSFKQTASRKLTSGDVHIKQIAAMEQEIAPLCKLDHPRLVRYHSLCYNDGIISVLQDLVVQSTSLSYTLHFKIPLDVAVVRHYAKQILEAIDYLHSNSIVHKDLRDTSIFIDSQGNIMVSDFSLFKKIHDLYCSAFSLQDTADSGYPASIGRGGKKADVYRFGVMMLSLLKGSYVRDNGVKVPVNLPHDAQDFLKKCLMPNEQERWSCDQLLRHSFLLSAISVPFSSAATSRADDVENCDTDGHIPPHLLPHGAEGSRLHNEFEILQLIGSGGFGDVLKVRNKLDSCIYAIKRIRLNPSNKQLNKKIMREVKLLSRLNHENVVRYYNSWIEIVEMCETSIADSTISTEQSTKPKSASAITPKKKKNDPFLESDSIEANAPPLVDGASADWSHVSHVETRESSSSSDAESGGLFGCAFLDDDDDSDEDDDVLFEKVAVSGGDVPDSPTSLSNGFTKESTSRSADKTDITLSHFMFIQMEFCERSTLRTAIDSGLYKDSDRVWRLFREIAEGLAHIHQQGMIHRDLKPVNIFLDSNDHVKIGDFGLATTAVIGRVTAEEGFSFDAPLDSGDGSSLTGRVGTALYAAPELFLRDCHVVYTQKVDIYSLGIMFFEMCHPFKSNMERVVKLGALRQPTIIMENVDEFLTDKQITLIQCLLQHDPAKRPTSRELLNSSLLPPLKMEDAALNDMLKHTVSNPQSKAYKLMLDSLFQQNMTTAQEFTFDTTNIKALSTAATTHSPVILSTKAKSIIDDIMRRHGAITFPVPSLLPKLSLYDKNENVVHLMDSSGAIVTLHHDLRVPFARFVARKGLTNVKRYSIDKVYRSRRVYGCHPRELHEFSYDIVGTDPVFSAFELLSVAAEIVASVSGLNVLSYVVRLNHLSLLKALFLYCNIPEDRHQDVMKVLCDAKRNVSKFQLQSQLVGILLTDQAITMITQYWEVEDNFTKISSMFRSICKQKGKIAALAKEALRDLEQLVAVLDSVRFQFPVFIRPCLIYSAETYDGLVFDVQSESKKRSKRTNKDGPLAVGGGYNGLVSKFRLDFGTSFQSAALNAFGISFSLDRIVSSMVDHSDVEDFDRSIGVVVCALGQRALQIERASVLSELWTSKIRATFEPSQDVEEISLRCKESGITHIVILKDTELGRVRIRTFEKDRFSEKAIIISELVDTIRNTNEYSKTNECSADVKRSYSISESVGSTHGNSSLLGSGVIPRVSFHTMEKISSTIKRRVESQILSVISAPLQQCLSNRLVVDVLAVDLDAQVLRTLVAYLDIDGDEKSLKQSVIPLTEKYPRSRKYLISICEEISDLIFEARGTVFGLFGLVDNSFRIVIRTSTVKT